MNADRAMPRAGDPLPGSPLLDRLLAVLLLLPGALLALPLPLAPLELDPYPRLAGAGLAALAAVPAALLLLWRPRGIARARDVRGSVLLLVLLCWGLLHFVLGSVTDTFEARRALVLAAVALVLLVGGGHLGRVGREWLVGGVVLLSVLWSGFALGHFAFAEREDLAGVLGNVGPLSQAALPGAVIGIWLALMRRGIWFAIGLVAFGLFTVHSVAAPVNAGTVSMLAALGVGALLRRRRERTLAMHWAPWILAGLVVAVAAGYRVAEGLVGPEEEVPVEEVADAGLSVGGAGIEVRYRVWIRAPALLASAPVLGIGPGQFVAAFPPHRDPREAVLSRHGVRSEDFNEVEHPHNDWIHGVVQHGILGGILWLIFLGFAAAACVRGIRRRNELMAAAGCAGGAVLVNALFHAPLLVSPASVAIAYPLLGILLEADGRDAPRFNRLLVARTSGVLGLIAAVAAPPLVLHGRAMADYARQVRRIAREIRVDVPDPETLLLLEEDAKKAVARGLRAAPDAVLANVLSARFVSEDVELPIWDAILELRPHSFQAHSRRGYLLARAGNLDAARRAWEAAFALDPAHPRILRSLARVELAAGRVPAGIEYVATLRANGCLSAEWLDTLGADLLLAGRIEAGRTALAETDERFLEPWGGQVDTLAQEANQQGRERRADALRAYADLLHARDHLAKGDPASAVISYRQAVNPTRKYHEGGAAVPRLEKAAAEWLAGQEEEARRTVEGLEPSLADLAELHPTAREVLETSGLLPRTGGAPR